MQNEAKELETNDESSGQVDLRVISDNTVEVEKKFRELRDKEPYYCVGKQWYDRSEVVSSLMLMNYSEEIAQELADYFLRHIQHAFDRGLFVGVKKMMDA